MRKGPTPKVGNRANRDNVWALGAVESIPPFERPIGTRRCLATPSRHRQRQRRRHHHRNTLVELLLRLLQPVLDEEQRRLASQVSRLRKVVRRVLLRD